MYVHFFGGHTNINTTEIYGDVMMEMNLMVLSIWMARM